MSEAWHLQVVDALAEVVECLLGNDLAVEEQAVVFHGLRLRAAKSF